MFKDSKKSWFLAWAALISVQATVPAWAQASRTNFANTLQGLSDEEVAVQLSLLTKDEKSLLLNDIARLLDEDLNSLAELETHLHSEEKISVLLNTGARLSEVTMVISFLGASPTSSSQPSSRRYVRYAGIALGVSVIMETLHSHQAKMIKLDRAEAQELVGKIQLQRHLLKALSQNLSLK